MSAKEGGDRRGPPPPSARFLTGAELVVGIGGCFGAEEGGRYASELVSVQYVRGWGKREVRGL